MCLIGSSGIHAGEDVTKIDFDMDFIYGFSCKTGTKAEKIEPKVPYDEIIKRIGPAKRYLKNLDYKVVTITKNNFYTFYKKKNKK